MAKRKKKEAESGEPEARKPVLNLGGGVMRVIFEPGLGDARIISGYLDGAGRIQIRRGEDEELERMWARS
jgi:hypothetical protein